MSASEFEFQISLAALYPDKTKIFGGGPMRILLQDDRGPEFAVDTGIGYVLAPPQLGPLFISESNQVINIIWAGPGTLQSTGSLNGGGWTNLSNAVGTYSFTVGTGRHFFRLIQ